MPDLHAALEAPGAHAQKGDAVAVGRVHVGLDLEHEAGKRAFAGRDGAQRRVARARRGRPVDQRIQDLAHAEVVDGRTEEYRRLRTIEEGAELERVQCAAHQRNFVLQLLDLARKHLGQPRVVDAGDRLEFLVGAVLACGKQQHLVAQ